jgi:hypothetical protein
LIAVIRAIEVLAYVVRGDHLLVVDQPGGPITGPHVPFGPVREQEDIRAAVVRRVLEETGLSTSINGYLGVAEYDMSNYGSAEVRERHVFQMEAPVSSPTEPWEHRATSGDAPASRLVWFHLDDPELQLEAGHGALLSRVRRPAA